MNEQRLVAAQGLSRRYGPHLAVDNISLTLDRGEVLGLLGPNGAGKTTTLRMLVGSLAPSAGSVEIGGRSLAQDPAGARRQLGYLPETPPLHRELTVDEYLSFCARLHGLRGSNARDAAAQARQACGLDKVARQVIGSLSKGFQQRVGLAQAIVHKPPLIILDEPTIGLDPNQIRDIRDLIAELSSQHGIILSSHILPEVQAVCSRVMIIAGGREVYSAPLEELSADQGLVIGFADAPEASALEALEGVSTVSALGDGRFRLATDGDRRAAIAQAAVTAGWPLIELRADARSLEETFVALTATESPAREAA